MKLIVGSQAMRYFGLTTRKCVDTDYISSYAEYLEDVQQAQLKGIFVAAYPTSRNYCVLKTTGGIFEYEITDFSPTASRLATFVVSEGWHVDNYIVPGVQLALKMSHRYKKDSPHFLKTMVDIWALRNAGNVIPELLIKTGWFADREKDTYTYLHPKLNQTKSDFFNTEGVVYKYDHDSIHRAVALLLFPAYTFYMEDGAEVNCSKEKFFGVTQDIRLYGVYEEACVLAIERALVPFPNGMNPEEAFKYALMKVCTSITSGWFREFAWEHYHEVLNTAKSEDFDYFDHFKSALIRGDILPYTGKLYD